MKLLFDANLSWRLVGRLAELFPEATHVFHTGLERFTTDQVIWEYARKYEFIIVTADADFLQLAAERGAPPKTIRLENCNYKTANVEQLLRTNGVRIAEFARSTRSVLIIRNVV